MIGFRCLGCSLKDLPIEVSRCPQCDKENFVAECMPLSHPVTQLTPTPRSINVSHESTKAKRQVIGSSPAVQEQNESTLKDSTFFYEDSSFGIKRTHVESHGTKEAIRISLSGSNIHLKQEQPLQHLSQDTIPKKQFLPENQNSCGDTHSLPVSDSYSLNPPNVNFLPDLMRAPFPEPQHLMNFSHEPSRTEYKSQHFTEMTIDKQKTTDSSRFQNVDREMSFASSSHFESYTLMRQYYPESVLTKSKFKDTADQGNNSSVDFLSEIGNSSNRDTLSEDLRRVNEVAQQEAHSSDPRTRMVRRGKASALRGDSSSAPVSKKAFVCGKCSNCFKGESRFNAHVQSNCDPKPYKCNECANKYKHKYELKKHQRVHNEENHLRCDQCEYTTKWECNLQRHKARWHGKNALYFGHLYNCIDGK